MFIRSSGDGCLKSVHFIVRKLYWQEEMGRNTRTHQNALRDEGVHKSIRSLAYSGDRGKASMTRAC